MRDIYHQPRWVKLRAAVLRRDGYQCQVCKRYGKPVEATHVHHIFPVDKYPERRWNPENLLSLCEACHNRMHDRLTGDLSPEGMELMRRHGGEMPVKAPSGITLVMGAPGAGKTTWVRKNLGDGLCYDLDYLAAAVRLRDVKAEDHQAAVALVNAMLPWFAENARKYARVFIIRTAPTPEELAAINPDRAVILKGAGTKNDSMVRRIVDAEIALTRRGIPVETIAR